MCEDTDGDGKADLAFASRGWTERTFGKFQYAPRPDGSLRILGTWEADNIVEIALPWFGADGTRRTQRARLHRLAAPQVLAAFLEAEAAGLLHLLRSWGGAFFPRFVRGSATALSNHAWGTAFDVNTVENGLGAIPALVGQRGTVRPLVPIFERYGLFWGGHYRGRLDGMHFEVAKLV